VYEEGSTSLALCWQHARESDVQYKKKQATLVNLDASELVREFVTQCIDSKVAMVVFDWDLTASAVHISEHGTYRTGKREEYLQNHVAHVKATAFILTCNRLIRNGIRIGVATFQSNVDREIVQGTCRWSGNSLLQAIFAKLKDPSPDPDPAQYLNYDAAVVNPGNSAKLFNWILVRTGLASDKNNHLRDLAVSAGIPDHSRVLLVDDDQSNLAAATRNGYRCVFNSGFNGWGSRKLTTYNAFELFRSQMAYADLIDFSRPTSLYRSYASAVLTRQIPDSLNIRPVNLSTLQAWKARPFVDGNQYRSYMDNELSLRSAAVEQKLHISFGRLTDFPTNFRLMCRLVLGWNQYHDHVARPSANYQTFSEFWLAVALFVDVSFLDMCGAVFNHNEVSDSHIEAGGNFCIIRSSQLPKGAEPKHNMFVVKLRRKGLDGYLDERLLIVPGVGVVPYTDKTKSAVDIVRKLTNTDTNLYPTIGAYLVSAGNELGYRQLVAHPSSAFAIQTNPQNYGDDLPSTPDEFFNNTLEEFFDREYDEDQVVAEEDNGYEDEKDLDEAILGLDGHGSLVGASIYPAERSSSSYHSRRSGAVDPVEENKLVTSSAARYISRSNPPVGPLANRSEETKMSGKPVSAEGSSSSHSYPVARYIHRSSNPLVGPLANGSEEKKISGEPPAPVPQWYLDSSRLRGWEATTPIAMGPVYPVNSQQAWHAKGPQRIYRRLGRPSPEAITFDNIIVMSSSGTSVVLSPGDIRIVNHETGQYVIFTQFPPRPAVDPVEENKLVTSSAARYISRSNPPVGSQRLGS
jgi:hypothetical protein